MSAREMDERTRYLLGLLSPEETDRIERDALADDAAFEDLVSLEDELYCDYAQDDLAEEARRRFEERFLGTPEGQRRLERTRALLQGFAARPRSRARLLWAGLAAAAVLLVALWAARGHLGDGDAERSIAVRTPRVLPTSLGTEPTLVLTPDSEGPRIHLPAEATVLRLRVEVPLSGISGPWRAIVRNQERTDVWAHTRLQASESGGRWTIAMELPADVLSEDEYQLLLSGPSGPTQTFSFVVLRD